MKKVELLSGVGDLETLEMAVKCGADAVYLSLKDYGARKYAKNFTLSELEDAVKYCHLYGVSVYVTVNTLIHDDEVDDLIDTVSKLYYIGVDALIMQDIGMINLVKSIFPDINIHVSTQAHNCSKECVSLLESLGVSRVVLARELSLSEIKEINTDLELEVFIHGALCVSYSGQCLISSKMFGRSGNRGECAGFCRFLFDLYRNNNNKSSGYLLSTKDLFAGKLIGDLISSGVKSLKIEGRMKSKYYVGVVTKFYRTLIDKYYNGEELSFTEDDYTDLLTVFNREFTCGFLGNDNDIVNDKTCNHQGSLVGEVIDVGKRIKIKLSKSLTQGDGIRFSNGEGMICNYIYDSKGLYINKALKSNIVYLDNKVNLKELGLVYKTIDVSLNKRMDELPDKKIPVSFRFEASLGKNIVASIKCDDDVIELSSLVSEKAINSPTTKEDVVKRLSKLGNTPFVINDCFVSIDDNIFIPVKVLNDIRRNLVDRLITLRENKSYNKVINEYVNKPNCIKETNEFSFLVRNEKQLKYLLSKNVCIYVEDYSLYEKYKNSNVFYRPYRCSNDNNKCNNCLITNNGYLLNKYSKSVIDIYMNVYNKYSLNYYERFGYKVGLSPELGIDDIENLIVSYKDSYKNSPNVEVLVYGMLELMIIKYCPINKNVNSKCYLCKTNDYYLDDKKGDKFKLLGDSSHKVRVMDYQTIDLIDSIDTLKSIGVYNFRIDLLDEDDKELEQLLNRLSIV